MKLQKTVNKVNFYTDFVNILNGVLQLSDRESEVFSLLLLHADNGFDYNVNDRHVRDNIIQTLSISEANLSRYLSTIKTKGLIIRHGSGWIINSNIRPNIEEKQTEISFILNINEEENTTDKAISGTYQGGE